MKTQLKNKHTAMTTTDSMLVGLPTPTSISYMWNWGSMLGVMFIIQIMTGIILASHYNSSVDTAFKSIIHISRNVEFGFALRFIHMNGASIFFLIIFIHISRGILFSSFKNKYTWYSGTLILLIMMAIAFLGYVLPWGQMSFWGATVITNLLSAIPYVGVSMVGWLWGGFSIGMATLSRFFTLHFLMPFLMAFLVVLHLASLHETGSNKPTGMNPNMDKTPFHPFFSNKDIMTAILILMFTMVLSFQFPFFFGDPENFNPANPLNTPIHIQPEWYFLFAYAILRSIPNKLGGVTALILSILMITILSAKKKMVASKKFKPSEKNFFWAYSTLFCLLTWIGANPVEAPFENMGKLFSILYFSTLLIN